MWTCTGSASGARGLVELQELPPRDAAWAPPRLRMRSGSLHRPSRFSPRLRWVPRALGRLIIGTPTSSLGQTRGERGEGLVRVGDGCRLCYRCKCVENAASVRARWTGHCPRSRASGRGAHWAHGLAANREECDPLPWGETRWLPGRVLCCVETAQDSSLGSSIPGDLEGSGIKVPRWGSRHGHACSVRGGHRHGRARAFVVEATAERLGEKGARVRGPRGVDPAGPGVWPRARRCGRRSRLRPVASV